MWHQIPTHVSKTHKGWQISISKASRWNKHLKVTIKPAVSLNWDYLLSIPKKEDRTKAQEIFNQLILKYQHSFEVANLYPLIHPWGEAVNKAYQYVNKLGQFDLEKVMREVKL